MTHCLSFKVKNKRKKPWKKNNFPFKDVEFTFDKTIFLLRGIIFLLKEMLFLREWHSTNKLIICNSNGFYDFEGLCKFHENKIKRLWKSALMHRLTPFLIWRFIFQFYGGLFNSVALKLVIASSSKRLY